MILVIAILAIGVVVLLYLLNRSLGKLHQLQRRNEKLQQENLGMWYQLHQHILPSDQDIEEEL